VADESERDSLTTKNPVSSCDPSEAIRSSGPPAESGTVRLHPVADGPGKLPAPFVEHVERTLRPSSVKVIDVLALNPNPETWRSVPTIPLPGLSPSVVFTKKIAEDSFVPLVAVTFSGPAADAGTGKEHAVPELPGKVPVASVVQREATTAPATVNVTACVAGKPTPIAFSVLPTATTLGVRKRAGSTVK
jgi:hypothetical protein